MSGEERPKKAWYKKWWVWVIVVVVVAAAASRNGSDDSGSTGASSTTPSGSGSESSKPAEVEKPKPIVVTAGEYYRAYERNEVAADNRFKDKLIEISGTVESIEKLFGTVQVTLKAGDIIEQVTCSLSSEVNAASINKGDQVTLVGTGDGKTFFPEVDDCTIK